MLAGTALWLLLLYNGHLLERDTFLIGGWFILGLLALITAILLKTTPRNAIRLRVQASRRLIIYGTAALQTGAVLFLLPALSEDILRYRLDGHMWLNGLSPYTTTPLQFLGDKLASGPIEVMDAIDLMVPHKHLTTIYPPVAQVFFLATRAIEDALPKSWGFNYWTRWRNAITAVPPLQQAIVQRIAFALTAFAAVPVLLLILAKNDRSPWYAVLLAWHPLFVIETGGMGHVDVVGVLFVLLTIRALQSHRTILATAMLALAAGVKPHVILLAPFLLRDAIAAGSRVQLKWLGVAFIGFLALVYSPMLYQHGYKGWIKTSHIYATSWEANGSIYDLIKASADETDGVAVQRAKDRARMLAAAAVVVTMLIAWFARADLATAGYWIFLVALLFSPVVYPWYLLWVLCFVPLLRGWQGMTALVWAATVGVSYLLWRTSDWVLPTRWLLVEYVPVYATLVVEIGIATTQRMQRAQRSPKGQLQV